MKSIFLNSLFFKQWLVGLTDGDGTFTIIRKPCSWYFSYKISLFIPNIQLLYFLKKMLKVGTVKKENNMASYRIQDIFSLENILIPIFDNNPLLTVKQHKFLKFKKCLKIYKDPLISINDKNKLIETIWSEPLSSHYISNVWSNSLYIHWFLNMKSNLYKFEPIEFINLEKPKSIEFINSINSIITKPWLCGFIEAEGSFHLVKKDTNRIVHAFGIVQKNDSHILLAISKIFHIKAKMQLNKKDNCYSINTTNSRSIENIIQYFEGPHKNRSFLKGIKSLEFKIWARTYRKYKNNYIKLIEIQKILRRLRTKIYLLKE